jgi:hypothetical protein
VVDGPVLGPVRSTPHNQINSGDYPYLVRGYPSNRVEFVSYRIGTGPDSPYLYLYSILIY